MCHAILKTNPTHTHTHTHSRALTHCWLGRNCISSNLCDAACGVYVIFHYEAAFWMPQQAASCNVQICHHFASPLSLSLTALSSLLSPVSLYSPSLSTIFYRYSSAAKSFSSRLLEIGLKFARRFLFAVCGEKLFNNIFRFNLPLKHVQLTIQRGGVPEWAVRSASSLISCTRQYQ